MPTLPPPYYLRRVTLRPAPLLQTPSHRTMPAQALLLCAGETPLPQLHGALAHLSIPVHTVDVTTQSTQSSTLPETHEATAPLLVLDALALCEEWHALPPAEAAIASSRARLAFVQGLPQPPAYWLCCTQMGAAAFSPEHAQAPPADEHALLLGGAASGFGKCLAHEWDAWVRIVDLPLHQMPPDWLLEELQDQSAHREIVYHLDQRLCTTLTIDPVAEKALPHLDTDSSDSSDSSDTAQADSSDNSDSSDTAQTDSSDSSDTAQTDSSDSSDSSVGATSGAGATGVAETPHRGRLTPLAGKPTLLVTGASAGVTAYLTRALARQQPYRALLLARTSLPAPDAPNPHTHPREARQALRQELGPDAPARELQEAFVREKKRFTLAAHLDLLADSGVEAMYIPTDLQDAKAVTQAVAQGLARWQRFDVVIHGAGIDRSRQLTDKSAEELDLVVGTKLRGLQHLKDALAQAPPRLWLAFGSVSARFGNLGQADYAAANEAMARWLQASAFSRGLVIDYTAWDEVGMAAALASVLKERGVDLLPPALASDTTLDLLRHANTGEWVLSGRLSAPLPHAQTTLHIPDDTLQCQWPLTAQSARYLSEHQLNGAEIMPGVASLQWLSHLASQCSPDASARFIQDVQFHKALKLFPARPLTVHALARRQSAEASAASEARARDTEAEGTSVDKDSQSTEASTASEARARDTEAEGTSVDQGTAIPQAQVVRAQLESLRQRRGKQERHTHLSATFPLRECPVIPKLEPLTGAATALSRAQIYDLLFHGPAWQVLERCSVYEDGAEAITVELDTQLGHGLPETHRLLSVATEAAFQSAGIWAFHKHQVLVLPDAIRLLVRPTAPQPLQTLHVRLRFCHRDDACYVFQALLLTEDQQPQQWLADLQMRVLPLKLDTAPT